MYEIIGFERINYIKKSTGEPVNGYNFFLKGEDLTRQGSGGNLVFSKYFSLEKINGVPKVGAILEIKTSINWKGESYITGCNIC